jgi:5-methyltetrahydropteroyltriglutamate--homocysteine methyltransferase
LLYAIWKQRADIISDRGVARDRYSNRIAASLAGIDNEHLGIAFDRTGKPIAVPRVYGPIICLAPREVEDVEFLRANTNRQVKLTIAGLFTMSQPVQMSSISTSPICKHDPKRPSRSQ